MVNMLKTICFIRFLALLKAKMLKNHLFYKVFGPPEGEGSEGLGRHLGGTWEAFGRDLGGGWRRDWQKCTTIELTR